MFATESFKGIYYTLESNEKLWIDKIKEKLKDFPTGKPLRYKWFREKRYKNKRLYFLISEKKKKILLVSFASKKDQQEIINFINTNMK